MKPSRTIVGIIAGTSLVMGGVDASSLKEVPLERVEMVAENRVEAKQIGNIVETTLPWKDQAGLKVKVDLGEPTLAEKVKDKRKKEVITETVTDFDGGFKVDILLTEKPTTNRFCYTIEGAENYDFFYQPPLTEQEKANGSSRPPEIEGSYAVYHKTLKNHVIGQENYATGKVMHIPRPQVWELGNEEATKQWADLSYENGQLCVTAPQDFLDNADYTNGVRIDPTFGYTSVGASNFSQTNGIAGSTAIVPSDFFNIYSVSVNISSGGSNFKGVFVTSTGTILTNGIGNPTAVTAGWSTLSYTTFPTLSPGSTYGLNVVMDGISSAFKMDTTGGSGWSELNDYTTPTNPGSPDTTERFSIYVTYIATNLSTTTTGILLNAGSNFGVVSYSVFDEFPTTISSHGIVWGLTSDLLGSDTATSSNGGSITGSTSINILNLQPNTNYYYKAFATNSYGTSFGSILSFTTTYKRGLNINNGTLKINNGTLDL